MNTPWRDKCRVPDVKIRKVIPFHVFAKKQVLKWEKHAIEVAKVLNSKNDGGKQK